MALFTTLLVWILHLVICECGDVPVPVIGILSVPRTGVTYYFYCHKYITKLKKVQYAII